jgi:hypothetical protein
MSASGSSLLLCLVLVRMYFENATSQRCVEAKGSSFSQRALELLGIHF